MLVKSVAGFGMVGGIGGGDGLDPFGMVHSIGIELGFQTDAAALAVVGAALAVILQEVAGVELDTAAVGGHAHGAAGSRVAEDGAGIAEDLEIVVVAALEVEGFVVGFNVTADGLGSTEVHGGAFHVPQFAGGDAFGIGHSKVPGGEGQFLGHGGTGVLLAGEVKVAVVRQIKDGILIADAVVGDEQTIVLLQRVGHMDGGVAGVTLITVGTVQTEGDGIFGMLFQCPQT